MKTLIRIAATGLVLLAFCWADETPVQPQPPGGSPATDQAHSWSMVYLPELDWTESEVKQTVALLQQLKPNLVVSMAPCPFAATIRNLECKPIVLDQTQRAKLGVACGLPAIPLSPFEDTSTLHSFGDAESGPPGLVWLSSEAGKNLFNGPAGDRAELRALASLQVRKQLGERRGEVIFLIDPSIPTPAEETWRLPRKNVHYEQAASSVTNFACLRPDVLQTQVPSVDGISPRVPVLHWVHSGAQGMEWETLPTDGGPAIHHSNSVRSTWPDASLAATVGLLKAPPAPTNVPLWMDDYINNNPAIGTGNSRKQRTTERRFGWRDYGVTRDKFQVLRSENQQAPEANSEPLDLPHGAVRSPGDLFSITVGQLDQNGWYPAEGDDGINVYLDDLRVNKSSLLYFAGLSAAWPSAATWFTDRYVITSGTGSGSDPIVTASNQLFADGEDDPYLTSQIPAQTIHLFDLQTGRSFITASIARPEDPGRPTVPTERIFLPGSASYTDQTKWRTLWKAIEAGYHSKPEQPAFSAEEVAALTKLPEGSGRQWKDLGIWPPPETWRLAIDEKELDSSSRAGKAMPGGDPYLTYTSAGSGQRHYTLAISGYYYQERFEEQDITNRLVAHTDLFTTGDGSLRQLDSIQRIGDHKQYLAMAGTYQKPGSKDREKGKWMLLIDLGNHHSWSVHW